MPAWSTEIASEFVRAAAAGGRDLDQIQLQKLVYIANGWCLAISDQPLTGDRPEAWDVGPVYRRLADALSRCGLDAITPRVANESLAGVNAVHENQTDLDDLELDLIARIYQDYGWFAGSQLSNLTRRGQTPWQEIYAGGAGRFREIPHKLIRAQFVQLAEKHSSAAIYARSQCGRD